MMADTMRRSRRREHGCQTLVQPRNCPMAVGHDPGHQLTVNGTLPFRFRCRGKLTVVAWSTATMTTGHTHMLHTNNTLVGVLCGGQRLFLIGVVEDEEGPVVEDTEVLCVQYIT